MDATTAIALVGIIVAGVVGPSVTALWSLRAQNNRAEHERELVDLAELRAVFDDAGMKLAAMDLAIAAFTHDPAGTEERFVEAWSNALGSEHRIATRLGFHHEISQTYHFAVASLGRASDVVGKSVQARAAFDKRAYDEQVTYFNRARLKFAEDAATLIGSRLPVAHAHIAHPPAHTRLPTDGH